MTEFESRCYGMSKDDIRDLFINSLTAQHGGTELVVMSILSDCQEMIAMKNPTIPSPNTDNLIRQRMNIAKFILREMLDKKETV